MKYHLKGTLGSQVATYEELCTLLAEIEACLNSRPLCTLSDDPFTQTYLSPGHLLIGEPITQLPSVTMLMSNLIVFPGGNNTNNFNIFGGSGQPTTSRVYNSVNAGRLQPPTCNRETWSW